jgi:hypothetical protein
MSQISLSNDLQSTDADHLDLIARAVGLVVLQWGQAEQSLELLVASLWQSFNGQRFAKKIPVMLSPKLTFVRACAAGSPELKCLLPRLTSLTDQFRQLSMLRHDLVHGAPASIPTIDGHFVFTRLDVHDGFHHAREVRIPVEAYPDLVSDLVKLGKAAHEAASEVFEISKHLELTPSCSISEI